MFENSLYPGTKELLLALAASGTRKLSVATTKPTVYAVRIAEHFGISGYFDVVIGDELEGGRSDKTQLIEHVLAHYGLGVLRADYLMVG